MHTIAAALVLALVALAPLAARAVGEGEPAPSFSAKSLAGDGMVSLDAYRGKVVYLDFWASWCAPCQAALPALEKLRKEFPADQFQVVAVNVDTDTEKALRLVEHLEDHEDVQSVATNLEIPAGFVMAE